MSHTLMWNGIRAAYCGVRRLPMPRGKWRVLHLLERLAGSDRGVIHFDLGERVYVSLSDHIETFIYRHGAYEEEVTAAFCSLLRPGATVLDVGAHVGYYTLLAAARVGPLGSVHSFEPVPPTFVRLQSNVVLNAYDNVYPNRLALSEQEGFISIYPANGRNTGTSSALMSPDNADVPIQVATTTIDAYVRRQRLGHVDLIKVDVEGAELPVLQGSEETLGA